MEDDDFIQIDASPNRFDTMGHTKQSFNFSQAIEFQKFTSNEETKDGLGHDLDDKSSDASFSASSTDSEWKYKLIQPIKMNKD